jgi:hypothetical protein
LAEKSLEAARLAMQGGRQRQGSQGSQGLGAPPMGAAPYPDMQQQYMQQQQQQQYMQQQYMQQQYMQQPQQQQQQQQQPQQPGSMGMMQQPGMGMMQQPGMGMMQQPGMGMMQQPGMGMMQPGMGMGMMQPGMGMGMMGQQMPPPEGGAEGEPEDDGMGAGAGLEPEPELEPEAEPLPPPGSLAEAPAEAPEVRGLPGLVVKLKPKMKTDMFRLEEEVVDMGGGRKRTFYKVAHVDPKALKILSQKQKKYERYDALAPTDDPKAAKKKGQTKNELQLALEAAVEVVPDMITEAVDDLASAVLGDDEIAHRQTDALRLKDLLEKGEDCITGLYVQSVMGQNVKDYESPQMLLHLVHETRPTRLTLVSRKVDVDFAQDPDEPQLTRDQRIRAAARSIELFKRKQKVQNFIQVTEEGANVDEIEAAQVMEQLRDLETRRKQAYLEHLQSEKLLELERRAQKLGVARETLSDLMETPNPKEVSTP